MRSATCVPGSFALAAGRLAIVLVVALTAGAALAADELEAGLGGAKLEPTRLRAYEEGDVGWAADQPRVVLPNGNQVSMRITAVFRRENGKWKWIHSHASISVSNRDAIGMELPT